MFWPSLRCSSMSVYLDLRFWMSIIVLTSLLFYFIRSWLLKDYHKAKKFEWFYLLVDSFLVLIKVFGPFNNLEFFVGLRNFLSSHYSVIPSHSILEGRSTFLGSKSFYSIIERMENFLRFYELTFIPFSRAIFCRCLFYRLKSIHISYTF